MVFAITLFALATANNTLAQSGADNTPAQPDASETAAPPTPANFTQMHLVWVLPELGHDIAITCAAQAAGSFQSGIEKDGPVTHEGTIHVTPTPSHGDTRGPNNPDWSVTWTPGLSDDGSISLSASVSHKDDPAVATQVTVPAKAASLGFAIGPAKVKIVSTTVSSDEPPIIDKVWGLIVCRNAESPPQSTLPPELLNQVAVLVGFNPVVLASTEITSNTPSLSTKNAGVTSTLSFNPITNSGARGARGKNARGRGAVDQPQQASAPAPAPVPLLPNFSQIHLSYIESSEARSNNFSFTSPIWVGAPIVAGPLQVLANDTYVVCIAVAKPDPEHAKQVLAGVRTWTARTGQTTRATFVKEENGRVTLHKEDGSDVTLALSVLSDGDVELINEAKTAAP